MTLYEALRKNWIIARKARMPEVSAYTLLIGELDRLKGTKDKWTNTLQTGNPEDLIVKKVCDGLRNSEAEKAKLGVPVDSILLSVLDKEVPLPVKMSEEVISEWLLANVNLAALKSPMQAVGIVKKHFGDAADGETVKAAITKLVG